MPDKIYIDLIYMIGCEFRESFKLKLMTRVVFPYLTYFKLLQDMGFNLFFLDKSKAFSESHPIVSTNL